MSLKHFNKTQVLSSYNKERIVFFISLIMMIISSSISVYAANYLYSSSEVSFDNSSSGISSDNVQGAIDELYQNASDYSSLESRIGVLEGHWKNGATSYFDAEDGYEWLRIVNSTTGKNRGISIHDSNDTKRGLLYFQPGDETVRLDARNSAGTAGQGKLNLLGNPVMVNG
ncbi:MAG: hypothetical protein IJ105_01515, partial [Bacilli bacterium]|nr:hypothetical protein [Bacilli bacterium]